MSEYIKVDENNIDHEHICCALSGNEANVKKVWMKEQFKHGYTFIKLNERAKVFVDYVPSEYAFSPIKAENMMFVYCLWVSGKYAKQGHASKLLEMAEKDAIARGKDGMIFVSSKKKKSYLSDCKFLMKKGYEIVDEGYDDYILMFKAFSENVVKPCFLDSVKHENENNDGLVLYYTNQCVFSEKYAKSIYDKTLEKGWDMKLIKLNNREDVCENGVISTSYSIFFNGRFVTNEIMSVAKFEKEMIKFYE